MWTTPVIGAAAQAGEPHTEPIPLHAWGTTVPGAGSPCAGGSWTRGSRQLQKLSVCYMEVGIATSKLPWLQNYCNKIWKLLHVKHSCARLYLSNYYLTVLRNSSCIFIFCAMLLHPRNGINTLYHFAIQKLFMPLRSIPSITWGRKNCRGVLGGKSSITSKSSLLLYTSSPTSCTHRYFIIHTAFWYHFTMPLCITNSVWSFLASFDSQGLGSEERSIK